MDGVKTKKNVSTIPGVVRFEKEDNPDYEEGIKKQQDLDHQRWSAFQTTEGCRHGNGMRYMLSFDNN